MYTVFYFRICIFPESKFNVRTWENGIVYYSSLRFTFGSFYTLKLFKRMRAYILPNVASAFSNIYLLQKIVLFSKLEKSKVFYLLLYIIGKSGSIVLFISSAI